jgi:hypothetical protein
MSERLLTSLWREELTDWGDHKIVNHTYITRGSQLIGYVKRGTKEVIEFSTPLKTWAVTRRKFRKLSKKEIRTYLDITK